MRGAPRWALLVAARILQAIGAAIGVPASLALVLEAHSERERGAHGVALMERGGGASPPASARASVASSVEAGGWRLAFLVNLPIGIVGPDALEAGALVESRAPGRLHRARPGRRA